MTELFFRVLLPMGIAGSVLYLLQLLLRPLAARLSPRLRRAAPLAVCALLLLPFPLLFTLSPASDGAATLRQGLRQTAATAPAYRAGAALDEALDAAGAANGEAAIPAATPTADAIAKNDGSADDAAQSPSGPRAALGSLLPKTLPDAIAWVYCAGFLIAAAVAAWRYAHFIRRLRRASAPPTGADETALKTLYEPLCAQMRLRRPPALLRSARVRAPLLAGLVRPVLVLPASLRDEDTLRYALRHELCHHKSGDLPLKLLLLAASVLHWYNPVGYLSKRDFSAACEEACDAAVTAGLSGEEKRAYAGVLLQCASSPQQGRLPGPAFGFASPARRLKVRLARLLRPTKASRGRAAAGAAALCALVLAAALAGCSVAAGVSGSTGGSSGAGEALSQSSTSGEKPQPSIQDKESVDTTRPHEAASSQTAHPMNTVDDYRQWLDEYAIEIGGSPPAGLDYETLDRMPPSYFLNTYGLSRDDLPPGVTYSEEYADFTLSGEHIVVDGSRDPDLLASYYILYDMDKNNAFLPVPVEIVVNYESPVPDATALVSPSAETTSGIDLAAPEGTPVHAAAGGRVVLAKQDDADRGNYVLLQHNNNEYTLYAWCGELFVKQDDLVTQGQSIATVGPAGTSAGSRCHFELWTENYKQLDPHERVSGLPGN